MSKEKIEVLYYSDENSYKMDFWKTLNIDGVTKNFNGRPVNPGIIKIRENSRLDDILSETYGYELIVRPAVFVHKSAFYSAVFLKDRTKKDLDLDDFMFAEPFYDENLPVLAVFDKKFFFDEKEAEKHVRTFFSASLLELLQRKYLDHQALVLTVLDKTFEELDKAGYKTDEVYRNHFKKNIKHNKVTAVFDDHPRFEVADGVLGKIERVLEEKKKSLVLYETQVSEFLPE